MRRFCNSINREHGADAWRTEDQLRDWLIREGFPIGSFSHGRLDEFREWREALLAAVVGRSLQPLDRVLGRLEVAAAVVDGRVVLTTSPLGTDDVLARIVAALLTAQSDGTWERLKACQHCRWVFYDSSKNRSGRWCTMQACGARHKAKTYRRRQASRDRTEQGSNQGR